MDIFVISLSKSGRWKKPTYDIVVMFKKNRMHGAFLERIGMYSPVFKKKLFFLNIDSLSFWLLSGAVLTNRVNFLLGKVFSFFKYSGK